MVLCAQYFIEPQIIYRDGQIIITLPKFVCYGKAQMDSPISFQKVNTAVAKKIHLHSEAPYEVYLCSILRIRFFTWNLELGQSDAEPSKF